MPLLPSQRKIYKDLQKLGSSYRLLTVSGECCTGKHYLIKKFLRSYPFVCFNLCDLCKNLEHPLTAQYLTTYLDHLTDLATQKLESNPSTERIYIYIRRMDLLSDVVSDYQMPLRNLANIIFTDWLQKLPKKLYVIVTTITSFKIENISSWQLELDITQNDIVHLLNQRHVNSEDQTEILKIAKIPLPGNVIDALRYTKIMTPSGQSLVPLYKEAYLKVTGSSLQTERDVTKPEENIDLIGMEDIVEEIRTSILSPIQINHASVPIKKGLVLCGPPGSGKTSIGRWLAHQIKGKLYLIGGEAGVSGSSFIEILSSTLNQARQNAPAVVFIDDVDTIFDNTDSYRAFLTLLDGIDNKKRANVCIIATCMNASRIPASLIRGGRLEMCLFTTLPTNDHIQKIVQNGFNKIKRVLNELSLEHLHKICENQLTPTFQSTISHQMSGWNCADINRCMDDVLRIMLANKEPEIKIDKLFSKCIQLIRQQYRHCGRDDSTQVNAQLFYIQ